MKFDEIEGVVEGPREMGPIDFCTGNWWVVKLEELGVHHVHLDIGDKTASDPASVDLQTAWRGSNLPALAAMWDRDSIYKLKKGPSSTKSVYGVYCERNSGKGLVPTT